MSRRPAKLTPLPAVHGDPKCLFWREVEASLTRAELYSQCCAELVPKSPCHAMTMKAP